jgi:TATA-box binding protein (TBP) (component of TFIID and TFIIIB)
MLAPDVSCRPLDAVFFFQSTLAGDNANMCFATEPVLKNIVVLFKLTAKDKEANVDAVRHTLRLMRAWYAKKPKAGARPNNFFCVQWCTFNYTVFPSTGSVVATGIKREGDVAEATSALCRLFERVAASSSDGPVPLVTSAPRVTNSTRTGSVQTCPQAKNQVSTCQRLHEWREAIKAKRERGETISAEENANLQFRPHFFPGVRITWPDAVGTLTLFNNGKFVIVGTTNSEQADTVHRRLCAIISKFWTTSSGETACAWSADSCSSNSSDTAEKKDGCTTDRFSTTANNNNNVTTAATAPTMPERGASDSPGDACRC